MQGTVSKFKDAVFENPHMAKLWLQFMHNVETICLFIKAEHLSDWSLHEHAAARKLNLFTTSGHFNYAKSVRLYVQMIQELANAHPWLYDQFANNGLQSIHVYSRGAMVSRC